MLTKKKCTHLKCSFVFILKVLFLFKQILSFYVAVCCIYSNSDEVWRHSAEAHHDLPKLRPGSVQTHEVSSSVFNPSDPVSVRSWAECLFSVKHQLLNFVCISHPTDSPPVILSFASLVISNGFHFHATLASNWRLRPSRMLNGHFIVAGFQVTRHILYRTCWRSFHPRASLLLYRLYTDLFEGFSLLIIFWHLDSCGILFPKFIFFFFEFGITACLYSLSQTWKWKCWFDVVFGPGLEFDDVWYIRNIYRGSTLMG